MGVPGARGGPLGTGQHPGLRYGNGLFRLPHSAAIRDTGQRDGHDGLDGATSLKKGGARIFAQDEATCVVFGMPKAVVDADLADKILPLERIAGEILNSV